MANKHPSRVPARDAFRKRVRRTDQLICTCHVSPGPGHECDLRRCLALWRSDEFDGDLPCVGSKCFDVGFVSGQDGPAGFGERYDEGVDG